MTLGWVYFSLLRLSLFLIALYWAVLLNFLCRTVPKCLLERLFKGEIVLLATRQQTLVEILQKQMDLVKAYVTMKEKLSTQPTSCPEMGQKSIETLKPAPDIIKEPAAASVRKNTLTRRDVLPEEAISHQGSSLKPGSTSECISFRMKAGDALIQGSAGDSSRHLSELIQRGLMAPGSVLQLLFKVRKSLLWICCRSLNFLSHHPPNLVL